MKFSLLIFGDNSKMSINDILICPVCKSPLCREKRSYFCDGAKKHCFDISAIGHVNLYPGRASGGDDKKAVKSRTDFLNLGLYAPLAQKLCELLSAYPMEKAVIDAGCGEGYYSNMIAAETGVSVLGFDLSKEAIISASKSSKRQGITNAHFFVGGIYNLPIADGRADAVINIFAPCAEGEFCRVLKDGGRLIVVGAGKNHLLGLKREIYEEAYTNEPRADMPTSMKLIQKLNLSYTIEIDGDENIRNLFSMTPYSYRTSAKDMQKLLALTHLETEVDFDIFVYEKEGSI